MCESRVFIRKHPHLRWGCAEHQRSPDFDVRNYGYSKLILLVKALGDYEVNGVRNADNSIKVAYVRIKGIH